MKNARLWVISILALALFGTCLFFLRHQIFEGVTGTYEEAALQQSEYKDRWISYEVTYCLGEYAEATKSEYFIPTGHEYYYLVLMKDGSLMPICVSKKADRDYLEELTDATIAYMNYETDYMTVEPRTFVGTVKSQGNDATGYYEDYLNMYGLTPANGWEIRYTLLDCTDTRGGTIALVCAVMLIPILGLVVCIRSSLNERKKKDQDPTEMYLPR